MSKKGAKNVSAARCGGESEGPQPARWEGSLVMFPWKWTSVAKLSYGAEFKNVSLKEMDNFQMLSSRNG